MQISNNVCYLNLFLLQLLDGTRGLETDWSLQN